MLGNLFIPCVYFFRIFPSKCTYISRLMHHKSSLNFFHTSTYTASRGLYVNLRFMYKTQSAYVQMRTNMYLPWSRIHYVFSCESAPSIEHEFHLVMILTLKFQQKQNCHNLKLNFFTWLITLSKILQLFKYSCWWRFSVAMHLWNCRMYMGKIYACAHM